MSNNRITVMLSRNSSKYSEKLAYFDNLIENESYTNFVDFDNDKLQNIVDEFIGRIVTDEEKEKQEIVEVEMVNTKRIKIPKWYLVHQGHELEKRIKEAFPKLNKFQKEDQFKTDVLNKIIDNVPELLSKDFIEIFKKIQK